MKLSEAMKAGIPLTEPITGQYEKYDPDTGKICGTCALGAAWVGLHGVDLDPNKTGGVGWDLAKQWPEINDVFDRVHPITQATGQSIYKIVIDLNDKHGWSREQVADWLEKEGL